MTEKELEIHKDFERFLKVAGLTINDFTPICYYEPKHRDAIIFQIKDCSFKEIEFDDFTLMLQNHVEGKHLVGIKIHNIKERYDSLINGDKFQSLSDYIHHILQSNGQFYNNTITFINQCQQLEIDIYKKIYECP